VKTGSPRPRILCDTDARAALLRGMDAMTGLLRPTLGPAARTVAIGRLVGSGPPEVLDNAATIARRTIQLADPFEDMGAMIVRHLVWRVFEQAGDGAATAAVIAQALMREAARYIAAGGDVQAMRRGIEAGLAVAVVELERQARPIQLPSEIAAVVAGNLRNERLANMLGEIVDAVGPDGAILVEDGQGTETGCEYLDGVRWNEGYVSHFLLDEHDATSVRLVNPRVLISDLSFDRAEQLLPALEACVQAGERSLLIVAPEVRDSAIGLLVVNRQRGVLDGAVAVRAPSIGEQRTRILEDLAVITGGRCLRQQASDRLTEVTIGDLGKARLAWATRFAFGILGGHGNRAAIRQRIVDAKAELSAAGDDAYLRGKIKERIGKLAGSAATIRVGAPTQSEQEDLKLRMEAAVATARSATLEGVVPGGGSALLACVPALEALDAAGDEHAGIKLLTAALAEPMRAIASNAGFEPGPIVYEARRRGPPCLFDVIRREWVDAWCGGVLDPLPVVRTALQTGVSAVLTALSADVLVRRSQPPQAINP
jgi:chaperonin GroEL